MNNPGRLGRTAREDWAGVAAQNKVSNSSAPALASLLASSELIDFKNPLISLRPLSVTIFLENHKTNKKEK